MAIFFCLLYGEKSGNTKKCIANDAPRNVNSENISVPPLKVKWVVPEVLVSIKWALIGGIQWAWYVTKHPEVNVSRRGL